MYVPYAGRHYQQWNTTCIKCHSVAGEPGLDPETNRLETSVAELGIACEACHALVADADDIPEHDNAPGARFIGRRQNRLQRFGIGVYVGEDRYLHAVGNPWIIRFGLS